MTKLALLIGVSQYGQGLKELPASVEDVRSLRQVLIHPEMGGFAESDVEVLENPDREQMEAAIYRLFYDRGKEDLLLFYFSGHGIKDESGRLYLSTCATRKNPDGTLYEPSALAAASLHDRISRSRSQHQVIILDCCFSGAIAQGMTVKDDGTVNVKDQLGGKGRAILTSSTSTQYSFGESEPQSAADTVLSIYTRYLVEGIRTGVADLDGDGKISVDELHEYARSQVQSAAPTMTPKLYPVEEGYKIILAQSPQHDPRLRYRKQVKALVERGQGKLTSFDRRLLAGRCRDWGIEAAEAEAIEAEVLQPYREYERKLAEYEEALQEAVETEFPFSEAVLASLRDYQQYLNLRDEDIAAIDAEVLPQNPQFISSLTLESQMNAEDWFNRAFEKQVNGDKQGAIEDYNQAIQLEPNYVDAYYNRGFARSDLDDKQGAIEDFNQVIQLNPKFADVYNNRGLARSELGNKQGAIEDFNQAIQLNPIFAEAYYNRGYVQKILDNKQGAIEDYNQAIQLDPNYAEAYGNRGIARSQLGDKQGAIEDYNQAIQLNPNYGAAYYNRGLVRKALKDKQTALADFQRAAELFRQQDKTEWLQKALEQIWNSK